MRHYVYILYSRKIDRYYIGATHNVELRLQRHNEDYYDNKWTKQGKPWEIFFVVNCQCKQQAVQIEQHIKRMKSRKYIENLVKYEEISKKLCAKYENFCTKNELK